MKKLNGFTLIELMITLAIGAILLMVAVPSFRTSIENNRSITQTNELLSAFNLARLEAIKRGTPVSVCASADGISCTAGGNWSAGWIVYSDQNGDAILDDNGDVILCEVGEDCVLRVWGQLSDSTVDVVNQTVTYTSSGRQSGGVFTLSIQPAHCIGERRKQIQINVVGRPQVTNEACN